MWKPPFSSGYSRRRTSLTERFLSNRFLIEDAKRGRRNRVEPRSRDFHPANSANPIDARVHAAKRIVNLNHLTGIARDSLQEVVRGNLRSSAVDRIEMPIVGLFAHLGFGAQTPCCKLIAACVENPPIVFKRFSVECH